MTTVSIQVPDTLPLDAEQVDLGRSILTAAVVKWYEIGKISQSKAAEILDISRAAFLALLVSYQVPAWQYEKKELDEEFGLE